MQQCDEGKPTCQRCEKSKRECGGYRPEFELVHRDQTKSMVRRLRKGQQATAGAASSSEGQVVQERINSPSTVTQSIIFVLEEPETWRRRSSSPSPVLTVPLAQRASCYFASNFILVPAQATAPNGFMEYLIPLIETEPAGSPLRYAFNACAFALLGNRAKADNVDLGELSLKEHTLALGETHKALGKGSATNANSVLAAVLLLTLYENITAIKESRMLAWQTHIDGAVHIVKSRGRDELFKTQTGRLLFTAVRQFLVSRTLSSGAPLPFGTDWWFDTEDSNTLLAVAQRFAMRYSEMRAETTRLLKNFSRTPESDEQLRKLIKEIQGIDREIAKWLASLPEESRSRTLCWVWEEDVGLTKMGNYAEIEVFPGRVDVYPDFVSARGINLARVARLLLAVQSIRLIACLCSPMDYRMSPDYEISKRICEGSISEIIASVPYHLGWHVKHQKALDPGISGFACGDDGPFKALPAYFLIWALVCVKNHDITSEEQRAWVKGRLRVIADRVGVKYAQTLNDVELRLPSMMIAPDGMPGPDPFAGPGLPKRPVAMPPTPESLDRTPSPSPAPG
ncbi:putative transcriptional regulatory protein [Podospora australis]|uniref:Transcriptional regulatory protein n=1 Tax=Podospora australis TaxID=1536484 RepID=A0AAN6WWS5_9PEZI|nr:putative transcriptional regulatory protein [Podospora australis]